MLECYGVGDNEVEAANFRHQIMLAHVGVLCVALLSVHPDEAGERLGEKVELRPVLAAFVVALVRSGAPEAERKTDDETEHSEQQLVDADCGVSVVVMYEKRRGMCTIVDELGYASDHGGPRSDEEKRQYHLGRYAAIEAQEHGPFGVVT